MCPGATREHASQVRARLSKLNEEHSGKVLKALKANFYLHLNTIKGTK